MARLIRTIAMLFVFAAAFTSCGKSMMEEVYQTLPTGNKPIGFYQVGDSLADVFFDDETIVENQPHIMGVSAEDTIKVGGTEAFRALEELYKVAADTLAFAYNHNTINKVYVKGLTMEYKHSDGKVYTLPCLSEVTVSGVHSSKEEVASPYYELSETEYTLTVDGLDVASATQVFVVEEGYVPPTLERVEWSYSHKAFRRAATVNDDIITVVCDNVANFADIYSDGSRKNIEEISYTVSNEFTFTAPVIEVEDINTVVGKTFSFENGVVTVADQTVSAVWKSAAVDDKVMHGEKDYASEITPCKAFAKTITFVSANAAVVKFYDKDADDYAEATVKVSVISEDAVLEKVEWSYNHKAFRRNASFAAGILTVVCDNVANFADIYSDGSRKNIEEISYTVSNEFTFTAPVIEVEDINTVVGKTFSFENGVVTVADQTVSAVWKSAAVDDKVMHGEKDYASEITPCKASAKTITFVSANAAVVKFYDNNVADYAEATVTVTVEENRRLISTDDSYEHIAYRRNADIIGANIAVTCDNLATFVDNYSDNTTETANVNYSVVNNFSYVVPTFVVNNMSNLLGQSFSFNNGTAVIEGKNVSIDFVRREVSAIMHNGRDYRSNAPVCEVVPVSITITSATTALVRFEDKNNSSDYSEAIISINIKEAEDFLGEVLGAWITDSYQGRAFVSTDLHVLTNNNGVYTVYSRPVNSTSWTATEITPEQANKYLAGRKYPAWVWTGSQWVIGVMEFEASDNFGYRIDYYDQVERLALRLGVVEGTTNGGKFDIPLKETASQISSGMWSISYDGSTWYFV